MTLKEAQLLTLRVLKQVMEEKLDQHNGLVDGKSGMTTASIIDKRHDHLTSCSRLDAASTQRSLSERRLGSHRALHPPDLRRLDLVPPFPPQDGG